MHAATIVPEAFLELTDGESFYMALAHLIKKESKYTKFFKRQSEAGAWLLMDNGAAEDAQLPSMYDILKRAEYVGATEVVLPDALMDKDLTLERTAKAINWLKTNNLIDAYKWMAVPQGRDLGSWKYCLINLLEMDKYAKVFNSIGISKFLSLNLEPMARVGALEIVMDLLVRYERTDIDIHLLGCAYDPAEIMYIIQKFPGRIRSCDSAIAYAYAKKNLEMKSSNDRPQFEIEFLGEDQLNVDLLEWNIKQWKGLEHIE